ncbi:popeye domain-containing protein 2 isoform X2 [Seriola lalandi dorsalis]|uniref:popeye domain-containing protein 2 isoform X2 n=1 Tax=Seriola lalandi dorsalis TaxID=1841481 RepID=UPI000C6F7664|nr:popeye domain-containing protein 2 isoform X2 [Seriola lalandi dorsalis]XP_056244851.1 popeye domain-containing 2 isoform X2 [Seriola aureovittata]
MSSDNSTLLDNLLFAPLCDGWSNNTEGAIYHLGNTMLFLGYMGGSGAYGCLFIFGFLTPAFLCLTLWGWMTMCGLDVFTWNLLLLLACFVQICHLLFRLHQEGIRREELTSLYQAVYLPLGVPVQVFKEIASAFENKVVELKAGETYAVEGKTPINQLSFLLSGRINVSLEGQFLHYIHRHQFLDSPEWESLRPNEEGKFQVTLTAEEDSRYISWRRRRLYMLISKERYIARLFSVMLGYDIAEKLYNLNNKLYIKSGVLLDIRLPSLYHVLAPSSQSSEGGSCSDGGIAREQQTEQQDEDQALVHEKPDPAQPQPLQPHLQGPMKSHLDEPQAPRRDHYQHPWASDPELPTGGDGDGDLPPRFKRGRAPLAPTDTPKL